MEGTGSNDIATASAVAQGKEYAGRKEPKGARNAEVERRATKLSTVDE